MSSLLRPYDDKYAGLAYKLHTKISQKVDRFDIAKTMWKLADYLQAQDTEPKHEQHLIMLASKWVKELKRLG